MKIIHENGKLFGKISIIDIIVIIIAIVLLYGVFAKYVNKIMPSELNQVKYEKFKYNMIIDNTFQEIADQLQIEDVVIDAISGEEIGKVSAIEVNPYKEAFEKINGEVIMKEVPNKVSIEITVDSVGTINNNEYLANGLVKVLVGEKKKIKTKYIEKTVTILSLEKVEE